MPVGSGVGLSHNSCAGFFPIRKNRMIERNVVEAFGATVRGPQILPDDPGYDAARSV